MRILFFILGFLVSIFFISNIFLFMVNDDTLWLASLPTSLILFFNGFYIEEKRVQPLSSGQLLLKKKRLNAIKNGIFFSCVLLLIILSSKI